MSGPAGSSQWMYATGFDVDQSLRFDNTRVTFLHRNTVATAAGRKKFTISCWFKLGSSGGVIGSGSCAFFRSEDAQITYESNGKISVLGGSATSRTSAQFRDASAWMHLVVAVDTTQGTAANRVKIYINGVHSPSENTSFPSQNANVLAASGLQYIGSNFTPGGAIMDGYLAEYHFLDTIAKLPADFGETGIYGEWKPKKYDGSHGTNGFYLPFKSDYTVEGFSTVTYKGNAANHYIGGVGFSSDLVWTKSTSTGGKQHILVDAVRGGTKNVMSESAEVENDAANRKLTLGATDGYVINSNSGHLNEADKTYVSWNWDMGGDACTTGIGFDNSDDDIVFELASALGTGNFTVEYYCYFDSLQNYDTIFSTTRGGTGFNVGTDADGKAVWYRGSRLIETASGTYETARWYHTAYVRIGTTLKCYIDGILKDTATDNGNYSELTSSIGALDSAGEFSEVTLDGVKISNTARYSANFTPSTTRPTSDSNTIFLLNAPTLSDAYIPTLSDASANETSLTVTGTFITSTTTGFAPSNADGSETSQVRANPTYGQSIVKYTGSGSAATLGHGLSAAPEWIFVKNRGVNDPWSVYYGDNTDYMVLDTTAATVDNANRWNDTSPTSSVFTVNTDHSVNADGENYIAYCWHSVANYTKIGTYTGDATTDGSLSVAVGFKPAFVIIKRTNGAHGWLMIDNTRNSSNPVNHYHYANTNDAEADGSICNFTSTGFDLLTNLADVNADGGTYTYMAHIDKREYAYWLDQSGNNNDWTSNNLTESDISVDSPTNNFATLNPLNHFVTNKPSQTEGNLKTICGSVNTGSKHCIAATMAMTSGKWYFEVLIGSLANSHFSHIGVANSDVKEFSELLSTVANSGNVPWDNDFGWGYDAYNGKKEHDNTQSTYGSQASLGDIIGVAVDMDNGKIWFADNNTYIASGDPAAGSNAAYTNLAGTVVPVVSTQDGSTAFVTMNFGQDSSFAGGKTAQGNLDGNGIGDFFYAPPSGFLALCSKNLPAPSITPTSAFKALLYTGTGSNQAVSGVGFQPDFLWVKNTATAGNNLLFDVVRGGDGTNLEGLRTDRETVASTQSDEMRSLDSDGFTTDTGEDTNGDGHSIISFNWKAGSGNTAFSESGDNPAGTHNANVAAGFSIVSYVGTGAVGTVAHGLGAAPEMMWVKNRDVNDSWAIYYGDNTDYLKLDLTTATADDAAWWNDTSPTSSVFTVATDHSVNADAENYIAYCWRSVDGFSKVGIYTGNGNADGAFIYLGFRPAWVFIKRINNGDQQSPMYTSAIDTSNPAISSIKTEDSVAIQTNQGFLDLLSNGFKAINAEGSTNTNGGTYLFMAFAEQPFQNSNAR